MTTNAVAIDLVNKALEIVKVLTIPCPNGDTLTVSRDKMIRWGKSRFASPSGKDLIMTGYNVIRQCGRGNVLKVCRKALDKP